MHHFAPQRRAEQHLINIIHSCERGMAIYKNFKIKITFCAARFFVVEAIHSHILLLNLLCAVVERVVGVRAGSYINLHIGRKHLSVHSLNALCCNTKYFNSFVVLSSIYKFTPPTNFPNFSRKFVKKSLLFIHLKLMICHLGEHISLCYFVT